MRLALLCAIWIAGCDGGDGSVVDSGVGDADESGDAVDAFVYKPCPIGELTTPAELQIVNFDAAKAIERTQPSQEIALHPAPQGGWMAVIGARARNLDGCSVKLTAAIVDAVDGQIIGVDRRDTRLVVDTDGWGQSSPDTFTNLQVCPQLTSTRDMHGQPYIFKVIVEDADGRKATAEVTAVPRCPPGVNFCTCECDRDYVLGSTCS
ncbi:MAG: hypothetical protein H0T42_26865 [Deltaproteobacteria bacterium]|nr:hypothetical protein [Deltaproteobacteria bacterium]